MCGVTLPYDSVEELRHHVYTLAPHLLKYEHIESTVFGKVGATVSQNKNVEI